MLGVGKTVVMVRLDTCRGPSRDSKLSSLETWPSKPVLFKSYCREHLGLRWVCLGGMDSELLQHPYLWLELPEPK